MLLDGVTSASSHLAACDLFPTLSQLCVLGQGLGVTRWALGMGHAWMWGTWDSENRERLPQHPQEGEERTDPKASPHLPAGAQAAVVFIMCPPGGPLYLNIYFSQEAGQ